MSEWLRTGDVAFRLRISAVRVRQLADSNKLPATKTIGGYRLFNVKDVEKLAKERTKRKQKLEKIVSE